MTTDDALHLRPGDCVNHRNQTYMVAQTAVGPWGDHISIDLRPWMAERRCFDRRAVRLLISAGRTHHAEDPRSLPA